MNKLTQYGIAVMTLSDVVDDFCLAQANMRQTMILANYRHARWAYKELWRNTLWSTKKAVLNVNCKNHTIQLPDDCEKVINIMVVDCNHRQHPLTFNPDINTAQIKCLKAKCSCKSCEGTDTLCGAIDSITVAYETVDINGTPYTKTIWTRYNDGAVQTESKIPAWDVVANDVVYNTVVETVCNVEVTEKGCIKHTPNNINLLREHCGVGAFIDDWLRFDYYWDNWNAFHTIAPPVYNKYGYFNYNAKARDIVHIFPPHGHASHKNVNQFDTEFRDSIRQVIVEYLTNGETPDSEILVPEYAVETVEEGIFYRQKQFNPRISAGEKKEAKYAWEAKIMETLKYLNPIRIDTIGKLQTQPRPW